MAFVKRGGGEVEEADTKSRQSVGRREEVIRREKKPPRPKRERSLLAKEE